VGNVVSRDTRLSALDKALEAFERRYEIPEDAIQALRVSLTDVPPAVEIAEKRLFAGLPARPSESPNPSLKENLLSAMKEVGLWKRMSPEDRDTFRKRLQRNASSIPQSEGRPDYRYADLEIRYAIAIISALDRSKVKERLRKRPDKRREHSGIYVRSFPFSRSEKKGDFSGPAFELLLAAMAHALPHSGAPKPASVANRLSALNNFLRHRTVKSISTA